METPSRFAVPRAVRAFFSSVTGIFASLTAVLLIVVAVASPIFLSGQANTLNMLATDEGATSAHWLGTDQLGRDLLARTLTATQLSLVLAVSAALIACVVGFPFGVIVALLPPRIKHIGERTIDTLLGFPDIILAIVFITALGLGARSAVIAIGLSSAPFFARTANTLGSSIAGRDYMASARVVGIRWPRLIFRYMLPNMAETLVVSLALSVSGSLVAVSALSFLGLGVQAPQYDWGKMLSDGVQAFYLTPLAAVAPAFMIATTGVAIGFLGEAVGRALNPFLWTQSGEKGRRGAVGGGQRSTIDTQRESDSSEAGQPALLAVQGMSVQFPRGGELVSAVSEVDLTISTGEIVGVVGESGSGKSSVALAVAQLVRAPGRVHAASLELDGASLLGHSPRSLRRLLGTNLAMVFQDPMTSLNPALRIGTQLTEAARFHRSLNRRAARQLASQRLREVHIPGTSSRLRQYPHEFSGGMRQRTMIAMGLMNDPRLIVADEPTTALDVTIQAQVIDLLREANDRHGTAILLISHNIGLIAEICDRVLVMYGGRIVEDCDTRTLMLSPAHPYTRALMAAIPDMDAPREQPLHAIPGRPPSIDDMPPGCPFAPRCPLVVDRCRTEMPPLDPLAAGHRVACWVALGREERAG